MRTSSLLLFLAVAAFGPSSTLAWLKSREAALSARMSSQSTARPVRYMVQLKQPQAGSSYTDLMKEHREILGGAIQQEVPEIFAYAAVITDAAVLARVQGLAGVLDVEREQVAERQTEVGFQVSDRLTLLANGVMKQEIPPNFWSLDDLDNWDYQYKYDSNGAENVVAYVLDDGVGEHKDLEGRIILNEVWTYTDDSDVPNDHGTLVAGIVAGTQAGVAKSIKIASIKVCSRYGCPYMDIIAGIWRVIRHHNQRRKTNPKAASEINLSLGGPANWRFDTAIRHAVRRNITVVVAAGNYGHDSCFFSPSREPAAITVGSSDEDSVFSWFSGRGKCVDIIAPGERIQSCYKDLTRFVLTSGTSMSAPHVTGAVAVLLQKNPELTPAEIKQRLQELALKDFIVLEIHPNLKTFQEGTDLDKETPNLYLQVPRL